jgi:predicted transposase YdaD
METDSLFYRLFKEKPKLLFELLGERIPRTSYTFGSHEVKQTSLRTDGVLWLKANSSPIVFLEVQGYRDTKRSSTPASSPRSSFSYGITNPRMTGAL